MRSQKEDVIRLTVIGLRFKDLVVTTNKQRVLTQDLNLLKSSTIRKLYMKTKVEVISGGI